MSARISDFCDFLSNPSSEFLILASKTSNLLKIFGCWYTKVVTSLRLLYALVRDVGLSLIFEVSEVKKAVSVRILIF